MSWRIIVTKVGQGRKEKRGCAILKLKSYRKFDSGSQTCSHCRYCYEPCCSRWRSSEDQTFHLPL
jgi:hypothetical protein